MSQTCVGKSGRPYISGFKACWRVVLCAADYIVPPPDCFAWVRTVPPTQYPFRSPTFWSERARRRRRYFLTRFNSVNELSAASCVQRRKNQAKRMHGQKVMADRSCSLNRLRKKCYGVDKLGTTYAWACEVPTQVGDTSLRHPVDPKVARAPDFGLSVGFLHELSNFC